jgi:hypothetical protein
MCSPFVMTCSTYFDFKGNQEKVPYFFHSASSAHINIFRRCKNKMVYIYRRFMIYLKLRLLNLLINFSPFEVVGHM